MVNKQMWLLTLCLVSIAFVVGQDNPTNTTSEDARTGKVFSLFSVVTFKNTGCRSQSTMTSGQSTLRNGTCFTSSECAAKGGSASGNCAAGFGVCCLFLVSTSGTTINQNCTYLRNPGFPSTYTSTGSLSFTIAKCSSDICYLRLDFETFTTVGPTLSTEGATTTYTCPDTFKVTTNTGQSIPTICGANTGQHIYVDIGTLASDTATLAFTFGTTATTPRAWEIKVSQITCSNPNRPPNGCLQYWTTLTGRMTTFNFLTTTSSSNLPSQSYSQCVRKAAGYCCIQYQACPDQIFAFSLDGSLAATAAAAKALQDTDCTLDYIAIPGASVLGCSFSNNALTQKFCGMYLGAELGAVVSSNVPVCDCTDPFEVYIRTDNVGDTMGTAAPLGYSRGTCLDFMQVPCSTN